MKPPCPVIDANIMLGHGDWTQDGMPVTPEAVIEAMNIAGIHEALIRDSAGEVGEANEANQRAVEACKRQNRFHPVWMVMPPATREQPPPRELVQQMRQNAVAAAWMNYGAFQIPLEEWAVGGLLAQLEEARVPLFLDPIDARDGAPADATNWSGVVRLCRAFPNLPVIVTETRIYKSIRSLWTALDTCPNLHVDVSTLWPAFTIEFITRQFGAERILLGTQLPRRNPGVPVMQVNYADISPKDMGLILGGNIRRLMAWNPNIRHAAERVTFPPALDDLHEKVRNRASLADEAFYDSHGHVGLRNQRHLCVVEYKDLIAELDRLGVRQACVFSWMGHGDITLGNNMAQEAVRRYPDRFVGFTAINPNHGAEEARRELERGLKAGMRGIKLLSSIHRYPEDGPIIEQCCRFAHEHRLFILNHVWGAPATMRRWLENYPNACYITGHSAGNYDELTRQFPNLFICSCPFLNWGQVEKYVERYGADRIVFGSDLLDLPVAWGVAPIAYAKVPVEAKRLMLGGNLKKLLDVYGKV